VISGVGYKMKPRPSGREGECSIAATGLQPALVGGTLRTRPPTTEGGPNVLYRSDSRWYHTGVLEVLAEVYGRHAAFAEALTRGGCRLPHHHEKS
jgi:hypothetical protein